MDTVVAVENLKPEDYTMPQQLVDLSPGQLHKLAELIHRQEVQKFQELKFQSYAEQQNYLKDAKEARDKVYHILGSAQDMIMEAEADKDATKQDIAKDVHGYCTKAIGTSLKFIRSYNTRLTYLDKVKTHSDDLIKQLKCLDPATQQKEAQCLALEAGRYKKAALEDAEKFEHFIPNQFSEWLKGNKIKFQDLVADDTAKPGLRGAFKTLDDTQKLKAYDNIIAGSGHGNPMVTYSFEDLGKVEIDSGTSKVNITDGLSGCRVAPMTDGLQLARLVTHNYPDL
ncbi:uncharacterized protein LOC123437092 [Hordeum vulgare subsp. vulgare]|uniref:Uncharacterized protein n=1 Tax=Hordeum vulgare subsp. vulgare TaxID=112509 RepID=A0A8I6WAC3_HORVV|nr:uncharacterized protein LOC123437092 [Hordeum vulgare subsp. vulgare]